MRIFILLLVASAWGQSVAIPGPGMVAASSTVATPTDSPGAGTYGSTQSVTLSDATGSSVICYTIDGSTPGAATPGTCDGSPTTTYSGAISVASTTTIKAIGTKAAMTNSGVLTSVYTISATIPIGYRLSSGSATTSLNTTGAKLIVVQCNSFSAGCHTSTFADSASNTYTAGTLHTNGSHNIKWYWVINPTTSSTHTWTSSGSDTIYVSVYGAPPGGTSWLADTTATGYDTSTNQSLSISTVSLTPSVTGDIIVTGMAENTNPTGFAGTIITGTTNAAPVVFKLSASVGNTQYIYKEPFVVTGVTPSAFNGNYIVTTTAATTVTGDNVSPPGSSWSSGGTLTGSKHWASTPSGSCQLTFENEFNGSSKEGGANFDTAGCASTSAQVISWIQSTAAYIISAIAFKPN